MATTPLTSPPGLPTIRPAQPFVGPVAEPEVAAWTGVIPERDTLPFDHLADFAATGVIHGWMGSFAWICAGVTVCLAAAALWRRFSDRQVVAPYMRHNSGYFDE